MNFILIALIAKYADVGSWWMYVICFLGAFFSITKKFCQIVNFLTKDIKEKKE